MELKDSQAKLAKLNADNVSECTLNNKVIFSQLDMIIKELTTVEIALDDMDVHPNIIGQLRKALIQAYRAKDICNDTCYTLEDVENYMYGNIKKEVSENE